MILATLLLLCPSPAPQEAELDPSLAGRTWQPFDGVVALINEQALTVSEVRYQLQVTSRTQPVTTQEEYQRLFFETREFVVGGVLSVQAGQDMGLDNAVLQKEVNSRIEGQYEGLEIIEQAEWFSSVGLDRDSLEGDVRDSLVREYYVESVTGTSPGPLGRIWRDAFIRPGQIWAHYQNERDTLGDPAQLTVIEIPILADQVGGDLEYAREAANDLRTQVIEGADMGRLAEAYAGLEELRASQGLRPPFPVYPGGGTLPHQVWAAQAQAGDLSPLMPLTAPGNPELFLGYHFMKVIERTEGSPPPPFDNAQVQQQLRASLAELVREFRLDGAVGTLREEAFLDFGS